MVAHHAQGDPGHIQDHNDIADHVNGTTNVHGITDTSVLLSNTAIGSTVQAHSATLDSVGSIATQSASSVAITGGAISGASVSVLDNALTVKNAADPTKLGVFSLSALTTGTTRTYTLPDRTDTIVTLGASQTLVSKAIVSGGATVTPLARGVQIDANGGATNYPFHATNAVLGLDYVATEFSGAASRLDLRGGINVANYGALVLGSGASTTIGQALGAWHIGGAHNDALVDCASIFATSTENFSGDTHVASGTRWQFFTTANLTEGQYCVATIDNDGSIYAGSPDALNSAQGASATRTYSASALRPAALFRTGASQIFASTYATPLSPTFARDQATYVIGAVTPGTPFHTGFLNSALVKNDPAVTTDFASALSTSGIGFRDLATMQVDTATGRGLGIYRSFSSSLTLSRLNSGTITSGVLIGFSSQAIAVNTGITLDQVIGFQHQDPAAVTGTVTLQIGLNIPSLTTAATNVGIRNQSSTQLGLTQQCVIDTSGNVSSSGSILHSSTGGIGYTTGAGGSVTQATSRTTGVTINKLSGAITLFSAAGSATYQTFTVTNSAVGANDTVRVVQKSGTDLYQIHVTAVAAGSFNITFATTGGTTTEQPVFNFNCLKGTIT